jgi:hypothetical protein
MTDEELQREIETIRRQRAAFEEARDLPDRRSGSVH